jgi:hypothetical protein
MFMSQKEKARDADRIHAFSEPQTSSFRAPKDKLPGQPKEKQLPSQPKEASPSISEEWEKLIIIDDDDFCTPATSSRAVARPSIPIPPSPLKPLDEKTSRILERLEAPKAKKQRTSKPPSTSTTAASSRGGSSTQTKKPLLPFEPSASQPLKPTFNRLRRKPAA